MSAEVEHHVATALDLIEIANDQSNADAMTFFAEAQVYATLALVAAIQSPPNVPPGQCLAPSFTTWPDGTSPHCELLAGHAGAHECGRGSMGGTAVWPRSAE